MKIYLIAAALIAAISVQAIDGITKSYQASVETSKSRLASYDQ